MGARGLQVRSTWGWGWWVLAGCAGLQLGLQLGLQRGRARLAVEAVPVGCVVGAQPGPARAALGCEHSGAESE